MFLKPVCVGGKKIKKVNKKTKKFYFSVFFDKKIF